MINKIIEYKADLAVFGSFIWLQIAPLLNYDIITKNYKSEVEAVCYIISWFGGIVFVYYRVGKIKAEKLKVEAEELKLKQEIKHQELENKQLELKMKMEQQKLDHKIAMDKVEKIEQMEIIRDIRSNLDFNKQQDDLTS